MPAVVWLCGPPWRPGNTALVDRLLMRRLAHQHAAARAAQRLVRRRRDDVRDRDRRGMRAAGDQAGDVRDVGDEHGADLLRDLAERREVDRARHAVPPHQISFGFSFSASSRTSFDVDAMGVLADAVLDVFSNSP